MSKSFDLRGVLGASVIWSRWPENAFMKEWLDMTVTKETHIKIIIYNCAQRGWRIYEKNGDKLWIKRKELKDKNLIMFLGLVSRDCTWFK